MGILGPCVHSDQEKPINNESMNILSEAARIEHKIFYLTPGGAIYMYIMVCIKLLASISPQGPLSVKRMLLISNFLIIFS